MSVVLRLVDETDPTDGRRGDATADGPLDPSSAWLAAFALGLAHSETPADEQVAEVRAVVAGQPRLLTAAARRLVSAAVATPRLREDALALLATTAETIAARERSMRRHPASSGVQVVAPAQGHPTAV
jgi:hypothetical protein